MQYGHRLLSRLSPVVIVGGGHAGVEAASAAARMGMPTILITQDRTKIGTMSCNPSMGGVGKGTLVREIDSLDGVMGRCADKSGLHWRVLNRSRGPAVQGPRAQIHREWYKIAVKEHLSRHSTLQLVDGSAENLIVGGDDRINGLLLSDGSRIKASAVVLATGTFLGGQIHLGKKVHSAGRIGENSSHGLSRYLRDVGFRISRLKTGTPPRLSRKSMDFSKFVPQPGDEEPSGFSYIPPAQPLNNLITCYQAHTNMKAHQIVHKYANENAHIDTTATGPRYCPSIESKVIKFPERQKHTIWLEPETHDGDVIYPNGISMTMPLQGQIEFLREIDGLEEVEVLQAGYGVEYDFVDPVQLRPSLETKRLGGLFLAGQINGTTGYEEAAAQGLVAGANAALHALGKPEFILERSEGLSGVLIDDLVTKGVTEPYRMFTARSEFRMLHRSDNADERLTKKGHRAGLVGEARIHRFDLMREQKQELKEMLSNCKKPSSIWNGLDIRTLKFSENGQLRSALKVLENSNVSFDNIRSIIPQVADFPTVVKDKVKVEMTYAPYLDAAHRDVQQVARDESLIIPDGIEYTKITGLSLELKERLQNVQPRTLGQAHRIEGMTPAASVLLLKFVRKPHNWPKIIDDSQGAAESVAAV